MQRLIKNYDSHEITTNHIDRAAIAARDIGTEDIGVGFHYDLYPITNSQ